MMSQQKLIVLIASIFVVLPLTLRAQQTFQFSQYMFNGLVINPAYAGAEEALSLTFYNRSQWGSVEGAPTTQTLSAHTLMRRQHVGTGLTIVSDRIGVHHNLMVYGAGSYHLKVSARSHLSFGLQAGLSHRESDYQSLGANTNSDPKLAGTSVSRNSVDLGAGLYLRSPRVDIGVSVPQLMPARVLVNDSVSVKFNKTQGLLFSRIRFEISPSVRLEPGFLLKYFPGLPLSYDINANVVFHKVLITGLSYRKDESIDFLLRAQVTPQLQLGYGYDNTIGNVSALSQASHELMINYLFRFTKNNVASPR
jgi:type IX secretion system PorP/SprF family membrane protein